ncbi:MAG TPA: tetratricopeptide repeat protein [Gemmatales bacterium]|nr:tetratricopeptide repeat protein [Gemmatales bacterium]
MCCQIVLLVCLTWPIPPKPTEALPLSGLAPAKLQKDLCSLSYRISTQSEECQKFFDQGLGYFYSYVWTEAARSFETALRHDPQCAMAWWGLSRALQQWGAKSAKSNDALKKAYELLDLASYSEKQLIIARAMERGIAKDAPKDGPAQRLAAIKIIDELLMLHPDDEEAWMARGLLAGDGAFTGGKPASAPYYIALTKLNPLHPGANHELLHQYELSKRPALGWVHSVKFIESSPGIPHAWHMQGHLSTRLGRWEEAGVGACKAIDLQRTHNLLWNVKPKDDHQWSHHLETGLQILTHQGRYREARQIVDEMKSLQFNNTDHFARLFLVSRDFANLQKLIDELRPKNKHNASYYAALMNLAQGDVAKAQKELTILEVPEPTKPEPPKPATEKTTIARTLPILSQLANYAQAQADDKSKEKAPPKEAKQDKKVNEVRGLVLCKTGHVDQGLAILQKLADGSKNNYEQHAWGHGAYYMETWGLAALAAGKEAVAEEAFLEAIAHDPGSFHGVLGMQILCERTGRTDEAKQYQAMAQKAWQYAELKTFLDEVANVRSQKPSATLSTSAGQ